MELNKKQVGALLKVIGSDTSRQALCQVKIDTWGDRAVLVAVNGYIMCALFLDKELAEPIQGKLIRRDAIDRWYRLATGKNKFNTSELTEILNDDYTQNGGYSDLTFPEWKKVMPMNFENAGSIKFMAEYAKTLQDLDGGEGMRYMLNTDKGAMRADTPRGIYILMPMKGE